MLVPSNDYILGVYAPIRSFKGRVTIDLKQGEIKTYDNNTIMKMQILEEFSVLNDKMPSNELQLMMDNSNGDFDLLTLSNMPTILASKPTIETELGLEIEKQRSDFFQPFRYIRDWINGNSVNTTNYWNSIKCMSGATDRCQGKAVTTNGTMTNGVNITDGNDTTYGYAWGQAGGVYAQIDLGAIYSDVDSIQILHYYLDGRTFFDTKTEISSDGVNWTTIYDSAIQGTYPETSAGKTHAPDWIETIIEWIETGKFFLTSWKNDITNKVITMMANDYFALFSDLTFTPTATTNLKILAQEVLDAGGVPTANQIIDDSLGAITVNPFPERLSIREALQHIGIASRSAVFQDRLGNVNIVPFKTLDVAGNYIVYPRTQNSLFGYPSPNLYPLISTGGGMRYLDFEQMYEVPDVSLEKSIYTLIVNHYSGGVANENVFVNSALGGSNGIAFKIENPLVNTTQLAQDIATWYFKESNYNAIYRVNWRGNPILECADMILVEDSFSAEKQSRIYRQELIYQGYLQGLTESRGGV